MILVGKLQFEQFLSKPKFYQAPFSLLLPGLQLIALLNIVNIIKHARNHEHNKVTILHASMTFLRVILHQRSS